MRPKKPEPPNHDLFRASLEAILDPEHELIRLGDLIDWDRFDDAFGTHYHEAKGRRGLRTRLMVGLHLLKHMKGLSDEETCAVWRENRSVGNRFTGSISDPPHFQAFCGETFVRKTVPQTVF